MADTEKKAEKTKKKTRTADQKTRQAYRTAANKDRRAKAHARRWAKRRALTAEDPSRKGESFARNEGYRHDAQDPQYRSVRTVQGEFVITHSVGKLKLATGIPTKYVDR